MNRSVIALVTLLLTSAALAAPVPNPFKVGWQKPVDPDNDCKFIRDKDSLTVEVPGTNHDFDPRRECFNAPRLLRDIEGDFVMQVRIRIDFRPSAGSTVDGQPSLVAAGFLIIPPSKTCIRLEYGVARQGKETGDYAALRTRDTLNGQMNSVWNRNWKNWPLAAKAEHAYLRLERRGKVLFPSLSPDGEKWTLLIGGLGMQSLPAKLKVGLAAYSISTEPFNARFDQFKLIRRQRKQR